MKIRAGEDIKAGSVLYTLPGRGERIARLLDAANLMPAQFMAGRDIAEGELIDTDTPEGQAALVVMGIVTGMVAGEGVEPGRLVYLDADGKVRPMPQEFLSQMDIALIEGLSPDLVRRIARNLTLSETIRLMGLVKPDQDES